MGSEGGRPRVAGLRELGPGSETGRCMMVFVCADEGRRRAAENVGSQPAHPAWH